MFQPAVHLPDHLRIRPLLRPEHGAAALLSAQRNRYVAGNPEGTAGKLRQNVIVCYRRDFCKPPGPIGNLPALLIKDTVSQRLQHPDTSVIGCAASDSHNTSSASAPDRIPDHFPDAICCRVERVALFFVHHCNSGRAGHLNDSRAALFDNPVFTDHRLSQWACHRDSFKFPAHSADQGLHGSLSAVRQGPDTDIGIFVYSPDPLCRRLSGLQRGQAPFQRIDCNCNLHPKPPVCALKFILCRCLSRLLDGTVRFFIIFKCYN